MKLHDFFVTNAGQVGLLQILPEYTLEVTFLCFLVMAVFCLARDLAYLEERLGRIVVAETRDRKPVTLKDVKATGAMTVLLKDALQPNLVQTLEGNPALIHGGPFAATR